MRLPTSKCRFSVVAGGELSVDFRAMNSIIETDRSKGSNFGGGIPNPKLRAPSASGGDCPGHDLLGSSPSPAGASPVRVIVREPGSRLAARPGNGPGRSPAPKATVVGATERSVASSEACRVVRG
jgi:hypothetical protein